MGPVLFVVGIIATVLLGYSNPFVTNGQNGQGLDQPDYSAYDACRPQVNTGRLVTVDVRDELSDYYINNVNHPEFNKENKQWVLVKENATIPAWKVTLDEREGSPRGGERFAEMEHLGTSQGIAGSSNNPDVGKDVYIGIGWCNPETGVAFGAGRPFSCLDPLVQDTVFVVAREGSTNTTEDKVIHCPNEYPLDQPDKPWTLCKQWGENPEEFNDPPHTQENLERYWWSFNVYYDASKLPANPTYNDLPCWMRELAESCPGGGDVFGDARYQADINCTDNNILGVASAQGQPDDKKPRLIINKNEITITNPPSNVTLASHYISLSKLTEPPNDPIIGTAYNGHFNVRIRTGNVQGTSADHVLILDPRLSGHDGPYWTFAPILGTNKPQANSLQLGTFHPGIPSYFYEWWTPSCKPAIYLYPEKETQVSVKVTPNGYITESIPEHGKNGWTVTAYPNGSLYQLKTDNRKLKTEFPYLYYEAAVENVQVPKDHGWYIKSASLEKFFDYILPQLGLNEKESQDFKDYWISKLQNEGENWFITLIDRNELDRVEPVSISPAPDNFIRVRFYFEKIDEDQMGKSNFENWDLFRTFEHSNIRTFHRDGFTAVDWGGILANGTCGMEEISK